MSALAAETRLDLLRLARAAIHDALAADGTLARTRQGLRLTPGDLAPRGAFVTLRERGAAPPRLRGCIGCLSSRLPLDECVTELARKAALEDPRFAPLTAVDLRDMTIEISVIGGLAAIEDVAEIEIGRHGVRLETAARSAVFLPQVAPEHGWDRARLLEQLARKAGLPDDGWKRADLSIFEAEVFGESDGP